MIFFCNQLTGQRNEGRPRPSRPPCSESVSCILRRLQKQPFVVGNLPRASRPSARGRCRRRERGRGREGRGESGHKFFLPSFLPRAERSQLRLLIQGGRDRGPKTKRKTFVNQDVGLSVHLAGNELIRISIFFDLDSPPPSFPSPHFPASLPSPPAPAPLHFPTSSRPNSTWTLSG